MKTTTTKTTPMKATTTYKTLAPPIKLYAPVSNYFSIASIFKPIRRGDKRVPFEWVRDTATYTLEISGWETLDAFDLDVLLAVLHIAGRQVKPLSADHEDVLDLQAKGQVHPSHFDTCYAKFTKHEALVLLNKSPNPNNYEALKASINRLSKVHFKLTYKEYDQWMTSHLLSASGLDDRCKVVLNRELGYGLVQNHSRIWFHEREHLSEAGRILHTFLSGVVREGNNTPIKFKVDTLVAHIYNVNVDTVDRRFLSKYRQNVHAQATLIAQLWEGSEEHPSIKPGEVCFSFKRPPHP